MNPLNDPNQLPFLVSIIVTNYNYGKYLPEAIESALSQTYQNKEILVVDDGSTDNSVEIIRKYPVKLITKSNGGTASARNAGIKHASGQILAFLDADDVYYPEKVMASVVKIAEFPNIGLVYSDYDILDQMTGQKIREYKPPFDFKKLVQSCIVSTNPVVQKAVFDAVGEYNCQIRGMEDYEFYLRATARFTAVHIPYSLFMYREHGLNKTRTTSATAWATEEAQMKENFFKNLQNVK